MLLPKATKNIGDAPSRIVWTPIQAIHVHGSKGWVQIPRSARYAAPKRWEFSFDNLWDLTEAIEKICRDAGGREYRARAKVVNPARMVLKAVVAGGLDLAEVSIPTGLEHGFYMQVDCGEHQYHNFFVHLEDLIQLLHRCVMDVQGIKRSTIAGAVGKAFHHGHRGTLQ